MRKGAKPASKPTVEELEERIHRIYHFLTDWANSPDADDWLRYHVMVAVRILHGESLKGTLIQNLKTGGIEVLSDDHDH